MARAALAHIRGKRVRAVAPVTGAVANRLIAVPVPMQIVIARRGAATVGYVLIARLVAAPVDGEQQQQSDTQ